MSAGTGEDQAASAPATPEPATMVQAGEGSVLSRAVRQHTGRRRNAAARDAILDVTFELLRTRGTTGLTIDAIAEAAGVGRQTIYRWWPSKGAVAAEAMARQARVIVPVRDTTSFPDDLTQFLVDSFTGLEDSAMRRVLRHLLAAGAAGLPDAAQPSRPGEGG
jgi:AcrR family transcriptional regulator